MLSTPPAFILSQDQTLMFKFNLSQVKLGFSFIQTNLNLLFKGLRLNRSVRQSFDCLNYSLWIFQGFSLFSYQCSLLSELYIHQQQLLYLSKLFRVCQELFYFSYRLKLSKSMWLTSQLCYNSTHYHLCQQQIIFFYNNFLHILYMVYTLLYNPNLHQPVCVFLSQEGKQNDQYNIVFIYYL